MLSHVPSLLQGIEYEEEPSTSEPVPLTDEEKAEQLKAKGTECYKAADWQGAYEAYRSALRQFLTPMIPGCG